MDLFKPLEWIRNDGPIEVVGDVYNQDTGKLDERQTYHITSDGERVEKRYRI